MDRQRLRAKLIKCLQGEKNKAKKNSRNDSFIFS